MAPLPVLYPRDSSTRQVLDLSGICHIAFDSNQAGPQGYIASACIPAAARQVAHTVRGRREMKQ